jgi:ribosomal protein S18 acetylase RimI-like enzyme
VLSSSDGSPDAGDVAVRRARPGDAAAIAAAWLDAGRYYADMDERRFRVPSESGLEEWFSKLLSKEPGDDEVRLVVEIDGDVVGDLKASIARPDEEASFELMRDVGEVVLRIDALAVSEADRRRGAGTALMRSVEAWGRERDATPVFLSTTIDSPLSVPFYDHLGYERVSVGFWKALPRDRS